MCTKWELLRLHGLLDPLISLLTVPRGQSLKIAVIDGRCTFWFGCSSNCATASLAEVVASKLLLLLLGWQLTTSSLLGLSREVIEPVQIVQAAWR
jgi:hypothetical protein